KGSRPVATLGIRDVPARSPRRPLADPARAVTLAALWLLLALFVIYPLLMMLAAGFLEDGRPTIAPLLAILAKPNHRAAFLNSLLLGLLVGLLGTVLGFLFAFTVSRGQRAPRWPRLIDAAILLPLFSPPFTTSISFIFSFGPRGLITY